MIRRSDLYALGIILFELLAGKPPFDDDGTISLLLRHVNDPIPRVSEFMHVPDPNLDDLIHKALAKNPADRYQTAGEFAKDIERAFDGKQIENSGSATPTAPKITNETFADPETVIFSAFPDGEKPKRTGSTTLLETINTGVIKPARQNPLTLVALAVAIVSLLLVARATMEPENNDATTPSTVVDSMTGSFYFTTDFTPDDEQNSYWQQANTASVERRFTDDASFNLKNIEPGKATSTLFEPMYTYDDVVITMNAGLTEDTSRSGAYGIIFRYQDADNYNVFAIDSEQRYSIWLRRPDTAQPWVELRGTGSDWTFDEAINPAGESNSLRLEVAGNTLRGYVNDVQIVVVEEDTLTGGAIGIYLASPPTGTSEINVESFAADAYASSDAVESMTASDE